MRELIVVLCGQIRRSGNTWRSVSYEDGGESLGAPGSDARIVAGSVLFIEKPNSTLLVSGRGSRNVDDPANAPSLAAVAKDELVALGVPPERIIVESSSCSTYQQLLSIKDKIEEFGEGNTHLISNDYHLPRIKAMINHAPNIKDVPAFRKINLVSAEQILLSKHPNDWKQRIENAYNSQQMKQIIEGERSGAGQVVSGSYEYR